MTQVKIVTDSSIQLSAQEAKDLDITIIPLTVMIDGTVYSDGVTIDRTDFMTKMAQAEALPKTSQPALGLFVDAYDKIAQENGDDVEILSLHMMEAISGTIHAAEQAAEITKVNVTALDSESTDRSMAFQVIAAAKMAQEGKSMAEILTAIEEIRTHTKLYLTVTSLDNLVAGGRLNRAVGFIGGFLNIKVILEVVKGKITIAAKGRGMKIINKHTEEILADMKARKEIKAVGISHAGALEDALKIKADIQTFLPNIDIYVDQTSPIIATHVGPGTIAITYQYVD